MTLVGSPDRDGGFTADTVVVCARPTRDSATQGTPSAATRPVAAHAPRADSERARTWSSRIDRAAWVLVGAALLVLLAHLRLRRNQRLVRLLLVTVFYAYVIKVLDLTLFRFQSLIVLQHLSPNVILHGQDAGHSLNLTPLVTLTSDDVRTSLLNVLLMVPFGFGLPLVAHLRLRSVVALGAAFSLGLESLQLVSGLIGGVTFRIADVNDVIFNTGGAALGAGLFAVAATLVRTSALGGRGRASERVAA